MIPPRMRNNELGGDTVDDSMHVLMLTWEYPPRIVGGIARHVAELVPALVAQEIEVTVVTASFGDAPGYEQPLPGLHVVRTQLDNLWSYDFQSEIMHLNFAQVGAGMAVHSDRPVDVIHAHDWLSAYAGESLRRGLGKPYLSTIHATEHGRHYGIHTPQQAYIDAVEWWLSYQSQRVICCSDYMRDHVQAIFGLPWDKIRVVPNGVDATRFEAPPPADFRSRYAADDEKVVFFVGRMVREKGLQVLIEAAPKILHYHPRTKFVIAGGGDRSGHEARVAQLGLSYAFYFRGFVPDSELPWHYKTADVAVFPSLHEPFGIVALEAMAAGTPLVVADVGGLGSIVRHGDNGFKCYPDNPDSLGSQVLHVLFDPGNARWCADRALTEVHERYNWDLLARQTADVYRELV